MKAGFSFLLAAVLMAILPSVSSADLKADFKKMEQQQKGPFGLNYLQGPNNRVAVKNGYPSSVLFQAAYRNDLAEAMVLNYGFYTGNLFTTNYYQIMGEFVFGDAWSSHPLDHAGLFRNAPTALPKANKILRQWVLEKYYISKYPDSGLAKAFAVRGISGSEFEQEYANYFFDFYLQATSEDLDYLVASLLAKDSPILDSEVLAKARQLISDSYDFFAKRWGTTDNRVRRLYEIRNAIHNQLSLKVLDLIDAYVTDFPYYTQEGHTYLFKIKEYLIAYYSKDIGDVIALAEKSKNSSVVQAARRVQSEGPGAAALLNLSQELANVRTRLLEGGWESGAQKTATMLLLTSALQYYNMILSSDFRLASKDDLVMGLNLIYIEGYFIKDNWQYFVGEMQAAADLAAAKSQMSDAIFIGAETLRQAFESDLEQWKSIEPKMDQFIDDKVKSSVLNSLSLVLDRN
ncbi:MAG: hypothetical protein KDD22_06485 [Bdellovibrionales bacterium]|nr:hypothetical protein [Bdellovibrionales bacterium]